MNKILTLMGLFCTLLLSIFSFQYKLPSTEPVALPSLKTEDKQLLLPLDSRPVCTELPQRLAYLAGTNLIVPPKAILDNYENKATRPKLLDFLLMELPQSAEVYLSTDLLIHGGLIASRQLTDNTKYENTFFSSIAELQTKYPHKKLTMFSIVPRLLVSDQLIPDRWYKYYLFRYSQYYDIYTTTGDRFAIDYVGEYARKIPLEILSKYLELYQRSQQLGIKLINNSNSNLEVILGQDDSNFYGLSQGVTRKLQQISKALHNPVYFTQGADEIASLLIAKSYLTKSHFQPKVAIIYANPSIKDLIMPYQSMTCQELLIDKCKLLNIEIIENKAKADFILYINCGHDTYQPSSKQQQEFNYLLNAYPRVALLDLTANFEAKELLMPYLISSKAPLNKLLAYSGWNTYSNSLGTVLAQGSIITGRTKELQQHNQLLALYATNTQFNLERILEDYCYQKLLHSTLSWEVNALGYDATHMYWTIAKYARQHTDAFLRIQAKELLHNCFGQAPFYKNYYLTEITIKSSFPWKRTFEARLETKIKIGRRK